MSDYLGPVRLDIVDCLMLEKLNIPATQMLKNRFKQLVKLSLAAHFGLGTHLFEARQVLPLLTFRLKIKNKLKKMLEMQHVLLSAELVPGVVMLRKVDENSELRPCLWLLHFSF